jgi:hypothetical protein
MINNNTTTQLIETFSCSNKSLEIGDYSVQLSNRINCLSSFISLPFKLFGVLTNCINAYIFSQSEFKDQIFTYFLIHTFGGIVYVAAHCFDTIQDCTEYCQESYISQWLSLYNDEYFTACLAIFIILIEILISIHRYLTIANSDNYDFKNVSPYLASMILFLISLISYSPILLFKSIKRIPNTNSYQIIHSEYNKNVEFYLLITINIVRGPVFMTILVIVNFLTLKKFRAQMDRKKQIKQFNGEFFIFKLTLRFN